MPSVSFRSGNFQEYFLFFLCPVIDNGNSGIFNSPQPVPYKWNPICKLNQMKVLRPHLPCSRSEGFTPSMVGIKEPEGGRSTLWLCPQAPGLAYKYGSGASGRNSVCLMFFYKIQPHNNGKNPFFLRIANTGGSAVLITSEDHHDLYSFFRDTLRYLFSSFLITSSSSPVGSQKYPHVPLRLLRLPLQVPQVHYRLPWHPQLLLLTLP